ncbi:glycosyltransferase family 2 protein [Providencia rettgeri]
MKFDVIIPYYNKIRYIKRAINSIDFDVVNKVIIVDDHSSKEIPFDFKNPKITIIRNKENKGPSYSRNKGAELSDANYLIFLDADDFFEKDLFKILKKITFNKDSINLISWKIKTIHDESHSNTDISSIEIIEKENYFYHKEKSNGNLVMTASSFCIKRDIFIKNNGFNESLRVQEDPEFFCRISKSYKSIFINHILSYYDLSDENSLSKSNISSIKLPYYVLQLKDDPSPHSLNLYRNEYVRYFLLSLLNKSNENYKEFIEKENLKPIRKLNANLIILLSFFPSRLYSLLYKIFRHLKYGK